MGYRWDPNPWRVPKFDKKTSLYQKELTKDNEAFLEQTVLDTYQDKLKESFSPLKDGPWKRNEWTVQYVKFKFYCTVSKCKIDLCAMILFCIGLKYSLYSNFSPFLSRVSTLTHDIDIAILSVHSSVRDVPVSDENGLTYCHSFFAVQ